MSKKIIFAQTIFTHFLGQYRKRWQRYPFFRYKKPESCNPSHTKPLIPSQNRIRRGDYKVYNLLCINILHPSKGIMVHILVTRGSYLRCEGIDSI